MDRLLLFCGLCAFAAATQSACMSGREQSPINIEEPALSPTVMHVSSANSSYIPLRLRYPEWDGEYTSQQTGSTYLLGNLQGGFEGVPIGADFPVTFSLQTIEFHAPAEHQLNGGSYPLEMQLVHTSASGATAVLSVWYTRGQDHSPLLEAIIHDSPVSLSRELGRVAEEFYFYAGSTTSPPCGEGVSWFVLLLGNRAPLIASDAQIRYFESMWSDSPHGNSRLPQHINDRRVYHFVPAPDTPTFLPNA